MTRTAPRPVATTLSLILGCGAIAVAMVTILAGPFAPQPDAANSLGEFAGSALKAAWGSMTDKPVAAPPPEAAPWDIDRVLAMTVSVAGAAALATALFALVRGEPWKPATATATVAVAAIALPFAWQVALLICGAIIIAAFFGAIAEVFDFGG
ncbi:hypothetical protein [Litorisediminicola beolgyonensis]|uniref:Tripartite tricarboxylate transporter TctB family protein n=1 Tax=Litorisediminicola beolgyonensis TaxID=1173614 RepID=A0ABW3ZD75_9RHOB